MINLTFHLSTPAIGSGTVRIKLLLVLMLAVGPLHAQYASTAQPQPLDRHQQASNAMLQGNYAVAFCIWQPMADAGDNKAQYNIGWMYHNGYGLRIDDDKALYWWLQSATSGNADSHFALGDLYSQGQGVDKNMSISLGWYISAALKGHEPAQETLMALLSSDDKLVQNTFQMLLQSDWTILGDTMQVGVDRANTRRGPDKSYQVVTVLERGHAVIPLREQNGWTYVGITGKGLTAWIFSRLLAKPEGVYPVE